MTPIDVKAPAGALIRTTSAELPLPTVDIAVDVDCEFDDSGRVYLWGALLTQATDPAGTYYAFGDVNERALTEKFADWLTGIIDQASSAGRSVRWFHCGPTEPRQLRRILGDATEPLIAHATDVLGDVIRPNFYSPSGYGLKPLATAAGAEWRTVGASGADTYAWITAARNGDPGPWKQLLEYNEDDTRATRLLRQSLNAP